MKEMKEMTRAMMRKEKKKGLSHRDIFRKAQKKDRKTA